MALENPLSSLVYVKSIGFQLISKEYSPEIIIKSVFLGRIPIRFGEIYVTDGTNI